MLHSSIDKPHLIHLSLYDNNHSFGRSLSRFLIVANTTLQYQLQQRKMNFKKYVESGDKIIKQVAIELGCPKKKQLAARLLRTMLHVLRLRLPMQESLQPMAQFRMILKTIYVNGWKYRAKPVRIKHVSEEGIQDILHALPQGLRPLCGQPELH